MSHNSQLEQLRSEGKLTARGEFRLDRQKAREKMQKFQLRDPHHYVLEFVQAAHLLGAQVIRFVIDADEMQMGLNNATLEREDLEDIYDAAFSSLTDDKTRALRHLAFGLTAAQAMDPSVVRVEVVRDARRLTLEVGADGEEIVEEAYEPTDGRISIYLREKFRPSHLVDFFRNLRGDLAEKAALREHCAYSPRHIYLDDERISFGHRLPEEVVGQVDIETQHERGTIGILPRGDEVQVTILQNGVKVVEHRMKAKLVAARAVIESDRLTKNLSQSAFVEDEGWRAFVEKVLPSALYESIYAYVSDLSPEQVTAHKDWLRMLCVRLIPEALPRLTELLSSLALWPTIDHTQSPATSQLVSIDEFIYDQSGQLRDSVPYIRRHFPTIPLEVDGPALYFVDGPPRLFEVLCGEHLEDVTSEYERAYERQQNKRLWQSRPWPERPSATDHPHQQHFEYKDLQATIWISDERREDAPLFLVKDKHLLRRRDLRALPSDQFKSELLPGGLAISFAGPLPVNRAFDGVDADQAFVELAYQVVKALPEFIATHAHRFEPEQLQTYLAHLLFGEVHKSLLNVFGLSLFERIGWLKDVAKQSPDSPWALVDRLRNKDARSTLTGDEIDARLASLGPIAEVELFEEIWGGKISLEDLADEHNRHGEIWYARAQTDLSHVLDLASELDTAQLIARVTGHGEAVLERLFEKSLVYAPKRLFGAKHPGLFNQDTYTETIDTAPHEAEIVDAESVEAEPEPIAAAPTGPEPQPEPIEPEPVEPKEIASKHSPSPPPLPEDKPEDTPEARLIRRLRTQLTRARGEAHYLLDDTLLHALSLGLDDTDVVARTHTDGVEISARHPATSYAQDNPGDAVALVFLAASVYTSINIFYEEITDSHEAEFLMRLVEHLLPSNSSGELAQKTDH